MAVRYAVIVFTVMVALILTASRSVLSEAKNPTTELKI